MGKERDCEPDLPVSYEQGLYLADELSCGSGGVCRFRIGTDIVNEIEHREILTDAFTCDMAVHLKGPLDRSILSTVMNEIVRRHAVFRTTFHIEEGKTFQRVHRPSRVDIPTVDCTGCPDAVIEALISYEAARLMDLALAPPLNLLLVRRDKDDHVLCLSIHHLIFDGWSQRILSKEFVTLYKAFVCGYTPHLAEPKIQYADYMLQPRRALQEPRLSLLRSYWKTKLAGMGPEPLIEFPDAMVPAAPIYSRAHKSETGSAALVSRMKAVARSFQATVFMVFVAAVASWIFCLTGQSDIALLIPAQTRDEIQTEGIIGWFTNQVVVRVAVRDHVRFADVLERVRINLIEAMAHSDFPFAALAEMFCIDGYERRNPKRSTVFVDMNHQSGSREAVSVGGLSISSFSYRPLSFICGRPAINIHLTEQPTKCRVTLGYPPEWFEEDKAMGLIRGFMSVLNAFMEEPLMRVETMAADARKEERFKVSVK